MFFSTDGTKEAAFTTALLSATIALSIAKACKSKDVTECSCEGVKRPFHGQSLKWRGCSVNIRFGTYSAERFMLSGRGNNSEMNTIMKQNVRVGLEVNTVILRAWLRGGGRPREGEPPASVGWPISPNQFLLECGFLGQPGQVTRLACRYEFSPCFRWDSLHSGVMFIGYLPLVFDCAKAKARQNNMAANQYKPGEHFRRLHLPNVKKRVIVKKNEWWWSFLWNIVHRTSLKHITGKMQDAKDISERRIHLRYEVSKIRHFCLSTAQGLRNCNFNPTQYTCECYVD